MFRYRLTIIFLAVAAVLVGVAAYAAAGDPAPSPEVPTFVPTASVGPTTSTTVADAPATAETVIRSAPETTATVRTVPPAVLIPPATTEVPVTETTTTTVVTTGACGSLPCCPPVAYDGVHAPVWSTPDGLPPTFDCNGPGYRALK